MAKKQESEEKQTNEKTDKETEKSEEKETKETEETEEESEETEETSETEKPKPYGRYTQFGAASVDEYVPKLEEGYAQSSQEAIRLAKALAEKNKDFEVVQKIVNANPALKQEFMNTMQTGDYKADIINDDGTLNKGVLVEAVKEAMIASGVVTKDDPALQSIRTKEESANKEVFDEFAKVHPEIKTNPQLQEDFQEMFQTQVRLAAKRGEETGVTPALLAKTWTALTLESGDAELEGMAKMAQKQEASQSSSTGGTGSTKTGTLTDSERRIAQAMNMTDKDYLEGKKLSEEAKNK